MRWLVEPFRSQRGFTLVELLVAMSIFAVVLIVSLGAFVNVSTSANKAGAQRKVQQDARFNIEEIVRQARSSTINYKFYADNATAQDCSLAAAGGPSVLALNVTAGDQAGASTSPVFYYYDQAAKKVYRYKPSGASTALTCAGVQSPSNIEREATTASNLDVSEVAFLISPDADPQINTPGRANSRGESVHPRVTVLMTVDTQAQGPVTTVNQQSRASTVTVQTTVSTRGYTITPGEVGAKSAGGP